MTGAEEGPPPVQRAACAAEQSLRLKNDLFAGTDCNYTNGIALALVSHDMRGSLRPECLPRPLGPYTRFIGWADRGFWRNAGATAGSQDVVARFGQAMYTPKDSTRGEVIESDPPYAGLLYLGMAWNRRIHPKVPATRCSTHASSRPA